MVNILVLKKWVAALRSGQYKQGTYALRKKDDTYCCLGVLCDIVKKDLNLDWVEGKSYPKIYSIEGMEGMLPKKIVEYVDLATCDPSLFYGGLLSNITHLNDNFKLTFPQLADCIEATWPEIKEVANEAEPTND